MLTNDNNEVLHTMTNADRRGTGHTPSEGLILHFQYAGGGVVKELKLQIVSLCVNNTEIRVL